MNKRITSLLLCFVMVFAMLATAVPVLAATVTSTQLKVTPDKTTASPGDIITYTIVLGPVSDMGTLQMTMDIPSGLTYVSGSGKLSDNLKATLGFDYLDWTDISLMINGGASVADYESATDTELAKFQCKVDDGATGTLEVGLDNLEFASCQTWVEYTSRYSVVKTPVTITAAPKPATNITLNKSTTTIYTGGSETLFATVSPTDTTDTVTWESDKPSVATVDSTGKVSAVAPGTAIITAKAGSKSTTCTVTVEDAPCTHANISDVSAKSSTCQDKGWDAYKKCNTCGQLFNTAGGQISEIPYRSLASHTGGTATCLERATCTECGQFYGNYANHDYTKQEKSALAKKSSGTCKDEAVYWYSCNVCGVVERNDSHTFKGEKDPNNHIAATYKLNQKEANCKEEGYTGDIYCADCDQKLQDGTIIGKGEHNPSTLWSHDDTKHWKECTNVVGCGVKLQEGNHTSTGNNVANCKREAVCDTCREKYGALGDHDWAPATCTTPKTCRTCGATEGSALGHTGGTATCKDKAICSTCHQPYGSLATTHSYTAKTKKAEALKTAGTCKDEAVYYYSCSVCGAVEHNDSHTFKGDKDANNHTGGTTIINSSTPDHKNQIAGYTGDTKCLGCGNIKEYGTTIEAGAHVPNTEWSYDNANHWKECTVTGCGVVIDGTKVAHTSTGTNVATCKDKAVCDICRQEYGDYADHDWAPATCTTPKTCRTCGATEGSALPHTEGTDWKSDADNHWHICTVEGCGVVIDSSKTSHTFEWKTDKEATATENGSKHEECTVCGYKKTAVEIPATGTTTEPTTPSESTNQNKSTTPNESTKSENTTKPENSNSPKTGDNNTLNLLIALFFVSGVVVTGTTAFSRKRRNTK